VQKKTLMAAKRQEFKKGATGRLRRSGRIPGIMYGKDDAKSISIDSHEFTSQFHTIAENTKIHMNLDGTEHEVLVKEYQRDLMSGTIMHVDFYELSSDRLVRTRIPIKFSGNPKGVREGGILEIQLREVDAECLPKDLPEIIALDITELDTGHAIHVRDLQVFEGVTYLSNPEQVVANITHAKIEVAPVVEAVPGEGEEAAVEGAEGAEGVKAAEGSEAAKGGKGEKGEKAKGGKEG
jgi:large subunit ribosomal protein L25